MKTENVKLDGVSSYLAGLKSQLSIRNCSGLAVCRTFQQNGKHVRGRYILGSTADTCPSRHTSNYPIRSWVIVKKTRVGGWKVGEAKIMVFSVS